MWLAASVMTVVSLMQVPELDSDGGVESLPAGMVEAVDAGEESAAAPVAIEPVAIEDGGTSGQRETTVNSSRGLDTKRVAGSAQIIGREELERQEANDMHRVLQGVPGVYAREEDGFGLRPNIGIRGASADRSSKVTLMEDGVLLGPAPYSAAAAYYTPLMTRMVGVEVYKGPASIQFGPQTIGGAINFKTREVPKAFESDLDFSLGNAGALKGHGVVGVGTERYGVLLEGVHLQSDGFKKLDGGGPTGFDKNELMLKGRLDSGETSLGRHELQLKLGYSTERSHETYLGLSNEDFERTPWRRYAATANDLMQWWRTQGEFRHTWRLSESLEWETTLYRHDFQRTWVRMDHFRQGPDLYHLLAYPATGANAVYRAILAGEEDSNGRDEQLMVVSNGRAFVSQGVQSQLHYRWSVGPLSNSLEIGVRYHHDQINRLHTEAGFDMTRGTLVENGEEAKVIADNGAFTRSLSGHVANTVTWGRLLVVPGVRVEAFEATLHDRLGSRVGSSTLVVPLLGLGAVYSFETGLSILAGVHQGFSPPTPGQVGALPERALNSEAGLRFGRNGLRFEAIGFWSEYSNITGECTGSSGCINDALNRQFNGGAARLLGLEGLASIRGKPGWGTTVTGELAYTFTSAHFLSAFVSENPTWGNVSAGAALPYVPQHQGQLRVRANKGVFELGAGAVYYGQVREVAGTDNDPSVLVPGRLLLDATASLDWGQARFYLTATNLTNSPALVARRPFGARPQAPLLFQVGFKYHFR